MKLIAVLLAAAVLAGCAAQRRPDRSLESLLAARRADDAARTLDAGRLIDAIFKRTEAKAQAAARAGPGAGPPSVDLLVISGGGDWGSFGAGVLKGWGRAKGGRPEFDVVTGVSTGALIAPFAFLGDDASIERIVQLYRAPDKDIATSRGLLFFLPSKPSFYELPGLERALRTSLDRPMIERIAAAQGSGRGLLVNTTNVDLGDMRAWDLIAEARFALAGNDEDRVRKLLLASAGIPGAFPARTIGDYLYVDGAITGNILYGGRTNERDGLAAQWRAKHPKVPMPRLRYWVIFNNQFRFPPQVTQDRWPDIMSRATIMATQTSTVNSMRHLFAMAQIAKLKYDVDIEVRVLAVPDGWVPPRPGTFVPEVMNELADLGEKMGADLASWRTEPP